MRSAATPPAAPPPPPTASPTEDIADRPAPAPAPVPAATPAVTGQAVPCFHAYDGSLRGDNLFRIYVTDVDLLVFKLGPGSVCHGQFVPRTKAYRMPGGGVIGAIAAWQDAERLRLAARVRDLLETADEDMLRQYAEARDGGFVVGPDDISGEVHIDPPSFWGRLFGSEQEGVLKFHHRSEGRKTLALATAKDVRQAAEAATRLFGDAARINLPWAAGAAAAERP
jgi:hypothetical protein